MNPESSSTTDIRPAPDAEAVLEAAEDIVRRPRTPADVRMSRGRRFIVAGFVVTVAGIVLYCAACFAGGASREMDEILSGGAVPFAGSALAVMGLGTLSWLAGSFIYLSGAMDADFDATGGEGEAGKD